MQITTSYSEPSTQADLDLDPKQKIPEPYPSPNELILIRHSVRSWGKFKIKSCKGKHYLIILDYVQYRSLFGLFKCFNNFPISLKPVFRIRISSHADPDPGSQKCPYGYGSKEVNTKEE